MSGKRLIIIGAGGFGREVLGWATGIAAGGAEWTIGGFLDANPAALDRFRGDLRDLPILGDPREYVPNPGDLFVPAVGDPRTKLDLCSRLRELGAEFATLVHPTCIVSQRTILGDGIVLCPRVTLTCDVRVGDFVTMNVSSGLGHDVIAEPGCTLSSFCDVAGGARLMRGVFVGSHAVVLPGVNVGEFARIGAGSVVVRDVPAGVTVFGAPARRLPATRRDDDESPDLVEPS